MADVIWLACHSAAPLDDGRVERWASAAERALPSLVGPAAGMVRTATGGRHVLLVAWTDPTNVPATWSQIEPTPRGLALNDGFPIGYECAGLATPSATAIADALARDPALVESMHSPYANVAVLDGTLRIAIDALGFAKVYRARAGTLTVWASRPSLAALFTYGSVSLSIEGWTTALSQERFLDDTSAVAGVTVEPPYTTVRADDAPRDPVISRGDAVGRLFGHHVEPAALPGQVEDALAQFHRSLTTLGGSRIRIALSGGRDSRVVAATAHRYGRIDEFFTSTPPALDMEVAAQLVERLEPRIPWVTKDKGNETTLRHEQALAEGLTASDLWQQLADFQMYADGEGETPPLRDVLPRYPFDEVTLFGIGGEFARTFLYRAPDLARPDERTAEFWSGLGTGPSFVNAAARQAVLRPRALALRASLEERSVTGLAQLDWFYLFERMRRLKNRIGNTANIRVYFRFDFARVAHGQTPEERVATTYYRDVVRHTLPAWADVPYSHELKAGRLQDATDRPQATAFWASPYIGPLGRHLQDVLAGQHLVLRDVIAPRIGVPGEHDDAVRQMRLFTRLLNYGSYLTYLETMNREFRGAGGIAVIEDEGLAPDVHVDLVTVPRVPARVRIRRLAGRTRRGVKRAARRVLRLKSSFASGTA